MLSLSTPWATSVLSQEVYDLYNIQTTFPTDFSDKPDEKPTIDLNADPEPLPEYFKEDHPWNVTILEAPPCPKSAKIIRLVKTSPFDFDLSSGSKLNATNPNMWHTKWFKYINSRDIS